VTWTPPADVIAAGRAAQGRVLYQSGSIIGPGEVAQREPTPAVRALAAVLRQRPGVLSVGLRRSPARGDTPGRQRDAHEDGRALDVMLVAGPSRGSSGAAVAEWVVRHAEQLGAQLVIFDRTEWSSSSVGEAWEPYAGTHPHDDHVHIALAPTATPEGVTAAARELPPVGVAPSVPGWVVIALAVGALWWLQEE
jgi:hypothetical protein